MLYQTLLIVIKVHKRCLKFYNTHRTFTVEVGTCHYFFCECSSFTKWGPDLWGEKWKCIGTIKSNLHAK